MITSTDSGPSRPPAPPSLLPATAFPRPVIGQQRKPNQSIFDELRQAMTGPGSIGAALGAGVEGVENGLGWLMGGVSHAWLPLSGGIVGLNVAARTGSFTQAQADEYKAKAAAQNLAGAAGVLSGPAMALMYGADQAWSKGVARPASTAALLTNEHSPLWEQGMSVEDVQKAWDRSENVSFGRAAVASPLAGPTKGLLDATGLSSYDPWSDYDMAQADENPYYNFVTGSTDAALMFVVPPAAKAARMAFVRSSGLSSTIKSAADVEARRLAWEQHVAGDTTSWGQGIDILAQEKNVGRIRANPMVANSRGIDKAELSDIIARTDDPSTVNELMLANIGDLTALKNLAEAAPEHVWSLADMNSVIQDAWLNGKPFRPKGPALDRVNQTFDSIGARNQYFRDVRRLFTSEDGGATMGSTWAPSARISVEKVRRGIGEAKYIVRTGDLPEAPRWVPTVIQERVSGPASVFLQWVGSKQPLGIVSKSGARPNDVWDEFNATMNSISRLRGGTNTIPTSMEIVGGEMQTVDMNVFEWRQMWDQRLIEANRNGKLQEAWTTMENELVRSLALQADVPFKDAMQIVNGYRQAAEDAVTYMNESGGYLFDEKGARAVVHAVSRRQFLDSFQTLPMEHVYQQLRTYGSSVSRGVEAGAEGATAAFDFGMKIFRTNLLFRPGYIPKNSIIEPLLSSIIAHGTILTDEGFLSTAGNFGRNRLNNIKAVTYRLGLDARMKAFVSRQPVETQGKLQAHLTDLGNKRYEAQRIRDELLGELDDMQSGRISPVAVENYKEEVKGRLIDAQLRIDAIETELDNRMPEWRQVTEPATLADVRESLKEYRAILGQDPEHVAQLESNIAAIIRQAQRRVTTPRQAAELDVLRAQARVDALEERWRFLSEHRLPGHSVAKDGRTMGRTPILDENGRITGYRDNVPGEDGDLARGRDYQAVGLNRQREQAFKDLEAAKERMNAHAPATSTDVPLSSTQRAALKPILDDLGALEEGTAPSVWASEQASLDDVLAAVRKDAEAIGAPSKMVEEDAARLRSAHADATRFHGATLKDAGARYKALRDYQDAHKDSWSEEAAGALENYRKALTDPSKTRDAAYWLAKAEEAAFGVTSRTPMDPLEAAAEAPFSSFALTPNEKTDLAAAEAVLARVKGGPTEGMAEAVDQLQSVYDEALTAARTPLESPLPKIEEAQAAIDLLDNKIGATQRRLGAIRDKKSLVSGGRGFQGTGQGHMTLKIGGEDFQVPSAFSDRAYDYGTGYRAESSSAHAQQLTADPSYRASHEVAKWRRTGEVTKIGPEEPQYWDELAYIANYQLRGDKLIQKILEGWDRTRIGKWLLTPEGVQYQKSMNRRYLVPKEEYAPVKSSNGPIDPQSVVEYKTTDADITSAAGTPPKRGVAPGEQSSKSPLDRVQGQTRKARMVLMESTTELDETIRLVKQYFPDKDVRELIGTREVTPGELQQRMGHLPHSVTPSDGGLSRISGEDLIYNPSTKGSAAIDLINRSLDKVWQWIAAMPESRIARWPFYVREFKTQMQDRANILSGQGVKFMSSDEFNSFRQAAHRATMDMLEKTFYNIHRYGTPVYASRFLMSFPGAFFNSLYRYGRFAAKEPERLFQVGVFAAAMLHHAGVNDKGEPVDDIRDSTYVLVPGTVKKDADGNAIDYGLRYSIQSILSVTINYPAPSYLASYSTSWWVGQNPSREQSMRDIMGEDQFNAAFPFGISRNPIAGMFGGYQKEIWKLFRGPSDVDFMQTSVQIYADNIAQWDRAGQQGPAPTVEDAISQTRDYYKVSIGVKWLDSFAQNRRAPGQLMRDKWQEVQQQFPGDPDKARAYFIKQHGDWARWYTVSSSDYTAYIPVTQKAYQRVFDDFPDLTTKLVNIAGKDADPEYAALLALGTDGTFSQSVYNFYRDNPLPGDDVPIAQKMSPGVFENSAMVDEGWQVYGVNKAKYDAEALRLRTLRDAAKGDNMKGIYRAALDGLDRGWAAWVDKHAENNKPWGWAKNKGAENRGELASQAFDMILSDPKFKASDVAKEPLWKGIKFFLDQRKKTMEGIAAIPTYGFKDAGTGKTVLSRDDAARAAREAFVKYVQDTIIPNNPQFSPIWDRYYAKEWGVA